MRIRVSYGTAVHLGLIRGRLIVPPTTAYLMTYHEGRCRNDCAFCPQARSSRTSLKKLSRVTWPVFELEEVVERLASERGKVVRVCLQTVDHDGLLEKVFEVLEALSRASLPVSLSITPVSRTELVELKSAGVDYVGIGLDVASERLYPGIKRSAYSWGDMWRFLRDVVDVFGRRRGVVHLIVGLGETDRELYETMRAVYRAGGDVSLFAFTPIRGTALEGEKPPDLERYRRIQALNFLLRLRNGGSIEGLEFDEQGNLRTSLEELVRMGVGREAFLTRGCPGCNRPYYNERPGSEPYNYPSLDLIGSGIPKRR